MTQNEVGVPPQIDSDGFTIDEEFKDLLPPLNPEEYERLEKTLLADGGCRDLLVVWKEEKILVEGHHRYEICKKHDLVYAYEEKSFENRDAVIEWMINHQKSRRNMNKFQWAVSVLKLKPMYTEKAKVRKSEGGGADRKKSSEPGRTMDTLAKMAGISAPTLRQVEFILQYALPETLEKLRDGDPDYSINGVYTTILESLDEGKVTRVGIRKKSGQQTIEALPQDGSMSKARLKAKERASQKLGGKVSQGLVEQVDTMLSFLEELEQSFPITEDRIYIYEAVNVWQNDRRYELE